jgi:glutathione S-transferase
MSTSTAKVIWGRVNSTNVKKALWAAHELGLSFESKIVGGPFGGTKTAEYLSLNPNSQVPTLQDGDLVVWESNAIVRYLAAQYSTEKSPMWASDPRARALEDQWADWTSTLVAPHFSKIIKGVLRTPPEQQDWDEINTAATAVSTLLAIPNATLAKQPYLSGQQFGTGDIALGCFIYAWFEMPKLQRPELAHLRTWYDRLRERPAYQKAVMIPLS